jgi:hypothetical protein
MKIYNSSGIEIYDITVDDNSYSYRALLEISTLTLYFSSPDFIDIPLGSYCEFQGENFYLEDPANFKKHGTRNFEYTLILEGVWSRARRYKLKNIVDGRLKFSLTAKPDDHLQLIVDNMNLRDAGWSVGDCIDAPEKTINYNHIYCKDALQTIADEFQTEWEIVGKVIHLRKIEYYKDAPLTLSYGKGNGFKTGVGRTNLNDSRPVEVLYVQGGERNIDYSKYGAKELLLPKSQQLVYQGRTYQTDAAGLSIRRADKPVQFNNEDSLDLSHIYPSRVGTVSSVIVVDAEKHFYDFIDASIPADLNYNDCRIAGERAIIIFQSGILAGREFEIEQTDTALTGYIHAERRFKLVPQEMDGVTMPDDTFKPAIGDKYAVFGISLPDAYVCNNATKEGASWDMFREGAKYLYENEDLKFSFTGEVDGIWAKQNWLAIGGKIKPGSFVSFSDTQFQSEGILIRQVSVKQFVNNPYAPVVELTNAPAPGGLGSTLKKIGVNEVVTERLNKEAIRYAKRGFRDTMQTMSMLNNAMLNFTQGINPATINTMQILLGEVSLQYRFVDDMTTPSPVSHNVTFNPSTKILNCPAGIVQHMTLGLNTLSPTHEVSEFKFWSIPAYISPALDQANSAYYLYIKVSRTNQTGNFLLSETPIAFDQVAGYYHLFMGILNSENDEGDRSYNEFYGWSELTPNMFTINKIKSPSGKILIDLAGEEANLEGKFVFKSGSTGFNNLSDAPDIEAIETTANDAASTATTAIAAVNNMQIGGRNYLKGTVFSSAAGYKGYGAVLSVSNGHLIITGDGSSDGFDTAMFNLRANEEYTLSFKTNVTAGFNYMHLRQNQSTTVKGFGVNLIPNEKGRVVFTFSHNADVPNANILIGWNSGVTTREIWDLKLESGNKATDWTPAPEDIDDTIAAINATPRNLVRSTIYGNDPGYDKTKSRVLSPDSESTDGKRMRIYLIDNPIKAAGWFSYSFYLKVTNYSPSQTIYVDINDHRVQTIPVTAATGWVRYSGNVYVTNYINQYGFIDFESTVSGFPIRIEISDLIVVKGITKPLEWVPTFEETAEAIAIARADSQADAYIRNAIKNDTGVQGGLLSTSLIKVGATNQAGQWIEKAGINGAGTGDDTVRFFGGGTLAQAILRVAGDIINGAKAVITEGGKIYGREVELFGSLSTAPSGRRIELNQDSQTINIYDDSGDIKALISPTPIPSLAVLLASNNYSVNGVVNVNISGDNNSTVYSATLTLPSSSSQYKIIVPAISGNVTANIHPTSEDSSDAQFIAYLETPNGLSLLGTYAVHANTDTPSQSSAVNIASREFNGMPPGNYRIKLVGYTSVSGGTATAVINAGVSSGNLVGQSIVNMSRIHNDGAFLMQSASNYTYISPTLFEDKKGTSIVRHSATEKKFGILAAARITNVGGVTDILGDIDCSAPSSGLFTITHGLNHNNYIAIVTAVGSGDYTAAVVSQTTTQVTVQTRSGASASAQHFNIVIMGV